MKSQEAIRTLVAQSPQWSQNKLAARMGLSPQAMVSRMKAKSLSASFLAECASVFGYTLALVPPETKLPRGSIVVEGGE